MTDEEWRAKDEVGLADLAAWDEEHRDVIVYAVRSVYQAHFERWRNGCRERVDGFRRRACAEAAAKLFEGHPDMTIFPCDAVDVMPLLAARPGA